MNARRLYFANSCCALIMASVLVGAFYFQFGLGENPCPLCLLQRMGMIAVILGLSLNTFFGFSKQHFAVVILAALIGGGFSTRQVLLHIAPQAGEPLGYGTPFLGVHLYSWGVLIFVASIIGSAVFLLGTKDEEPTGPRSPARFERGVFYLSALICLANLVSTFAMCYLGPCCENGPCP